MCTGQGTGRGLGEGVMKSEWDWEQKVTHMSVVLGLDTFAWWQDDSQDSQQAQDHA